MCGLSAIFSSLIRIIDEKKIYYKLHEEQNKEKKF